MWTDRFASFVIPFSFWWTFVVRRGCILLDVTPEQSVKNDWVVMTAGKGRMRVRYEAALVLEGPHVREVRAEVYQLGRRKLPLDSYRQAVRWLETWQERAEVGELGPNRETKIPVVQYVPPGSNVIHHAGGVRESPLRPIAEFAAYMGRRYGIPNRTTSAYVLTDELRFVPAAWKIETKPLEREGFEATVTFRSPDLTREDLEQLLVTIRSAWGAKDAKVLGKKEAKLVSAMRDAGGEPEHGEKTEFWEKVAAAIDAPSWQAARRRAERLQEKLQHEVGGHLFWDES